MQVQPHLSHLVMMLVILFVSGCGGSSSSGPQSVASDTESTPVVSAQALSNHYVAIDFEGDPALGAANPENYVITDQFGNTLPVKDGVLSEDGQQVILTTGSQQEIQYQLSQKQSESVAQAVSEFFIPLANAASPSLTFTGSMRPEPALLTAISLSNTELLLTFSDNMSDSVEAIQYYRIVAADASTPAVDVGGVTVAKATLGSDTSTVILTTSPQDNIEYRVKVTNVWSSPEKKRIDPNYTIQNFFGIDPIDNDAPVITDVDNTGPTTIVLTFSEPVGENGGDSSNYSIYYCAVEETPCQEQNRVELAITDAALNQYNTQVVLTTLPQEVGVEYFVVVEGVEDQKGNVIDTSSEANTVSTVYTGNSNPDTVLESPKLLGSISVSNTSLVVSFSKPMSSSVENPANYFIVQENVNSEAGALSVVSATYLSGDRTTVMLTTRSQNELTYKLTVVNVRDTFGQELESSITNGGFIRTNSSLFAGTPPDSNTFVDADNDGLTDNEELSGYEIQYFTVNGSVVKKQVTSSPDLFDTDGDGINDYEEKSYGSNPRDADTDDDDLTDYQELNELYSDPFNQDTDGDGLTDGLEFNFFNTSPLFADTDGDQLDDFYEITVDRNPRISDLPQLDIEVGDINLQLDYRFDITNEGTTTKGSTENVSTTLTQARSTEYSKSDSSSHSFDVKLGFQQEFGSKGGADGVIPSYKIGFSQELSTNNSWTSSVSKTSSEASTREFAKSLESNLEVVRGETVSRVIENASISVPLYIKSTNDIAFTVTNIIITALVPSENDPAVLVPVASLIPATNPELSFSLGPLIPARGPLEFKQDTIYPSVVESLMENPRGVIFKVANYDIQDENGRRFAFTSQEVAERTAPLIFDFGGVDQDGDGQSDNPERYRVAVNYGFDVSEDKRVIFDEEGKMLGAGFADALEDVLGLTRYDEDTTPSDTLSAEQLFNSYATKECSYGTIMYRIRATQATSVGGNKCEVVKGWGVIQPDGSVLPRGDLFPEDLVLKSNRGVRLAYYADEDKDGLPNRAEYLYGCAAVDPATDQDTDDDLLDDRFEVLGVRRDGNGVAIAADGTPLLGDEVWMVELKNGDSYEARSRCNTLDSDFDGLSDYEEYSRKLFKRDQLTGGYQTDPNGDLIIEKDFSDLLEVTRDENGEIKGGGRTDPLKQDTDDDGISDKDEVSGYYVQLKFPAETTGPNATSCIPQNGDAYYVLCTTNPLSADSDGDTLNDGDEIRLSGDPTVRDVNDIGDQDFDGVTNREEAEGVEVTWERVSTEVGQPGEQESGMFSSSVTLRDTDADGLEDGEEYYSFPPTNPANADTDGDGLTDFSELNGSPANPLATGDSAPIEGESEVPSSGGVFYTNPNDADSDNDGLIDGEELNGWTVRIGDQSRTNLYTSDPSNPDADLDGLVDSLEKFYKTNPNSDNTDGDIFELSDFDEILLGTEPLDPQDFCMRFTFVDTEVELDGPQVGNENGWITGSLEMELTTIVDASPVLETFVISNNVRGGGYATGVAKPQGFTAVRKMQRGSYARFFHKGFKYQVDGGAIKYGLNNNEDFIVNASDLTAESPIVSGSLTSDDGSDIRIKSRVTAAVLNNGDIDINNLDEFCRPRVSVPDVTNLTLTDAVETIRENGFRLGEISRQLSQTVPAGNVISQTPADGVQQATQTNIDIVLSDGAVSVPDLVGRTFIQASNLLDSLGLELGILEPSYAEGQPSATVESQDPLDGIIIGEGGLVDLVFSLDIVQVPDLVGMTYQEASNELSNQGLRAGDVGPYTQLSAIVATQDPVSNQDVYIGSSVELTFE